MSFVTHVKLLWSAYSMACCKHKHTCCNIKPRLQVAIIVSTFVVFYILTGPIGEFLKNTPFSDGHVLPPTVELKRNTVSDSQVSPNVSADYLRLLRTAVQSLRDENEREKVNMTAAEHSFISSPKLRILIAATWRTGSSFLAELLNKYPGTFYSFEPMHFISGNQHINGGLPAQQSVHLLSSVFRCSFADQLPYIAHYMKSEFKFFFRHNQGLWTACQGNETFCGDPQFISSICQHCPINLIKSVRLRLKLVEALLKEFENLRIVWLTRHPGGIFASRSQMWWCRNPTCTDPSTACADLYEDWEAFQKLTQHYPVKLYHLKYENLSVHTHVEIKKLFEFLGLSDVPVVDKYIETHTKVSKIGTNPYTTFFNSKKKANEWKKKLNVSQEWNIRKGCVSFMNAVHY